MKVYINGTVYDSEETAIVLIFKDDNQRRKIVSNINIMPAREGIRMYAEFPENKYSSASINELFDNLAKK